MGAITLAHDIARHIGLQQGGRSCLSAYVEKGADGDKRMVFKRTAIRPGEGTLLVEDMLTTGGSVGLTASAVIEVYYFIISVTYFNFCNGV